MSIATVQFYSESLERDVNYNVILPRTGTGPYPVLMQLHGHGDNYNTWLYQTNLLLYARTQSMIIVLPDGGNSFYLNLYARNTVQPNLHQLGAQMYEYFLIDDLREHVNQTFHVRPGRWAIGGNSMGGYGAMRLGCKYPDLFASIRAHSGVYWQKEDLAGICPDPDDADIYRITEQLVQSEQRVEIGFDCGIEDNLLEHNRHLHAHMEKIGLPHHYDENSGGHTWRYWDEHVQAALTQHAHIFAQESTI